MITAIIIDDEPKSVFTLASFLETHCKQVEILGSANNIKEGKELLNTKQPQLVFLDIEMPMGSGFDLLNSISEIRFEVIFITAYNQYAINAFRFSALDYLLKPLRISELKEAVAKAEQKIIDKSIKINYELLLQNMTELNIANRKIAISDKGEQHFIRLNELMYLIADGNYTRLFTMQKTYLSSKNLKDFEELLPPELFCRVHHGHIINLLFVAKTQKGRGATVQMKDGKVLEVSVRKKDDFFKMLH